MKAAIAILALVLGAGVASAQPQPAQPPPANPGAQPAAPTREVITLQPDGRINQRVGQQAQQPAKLRGGGSPAATTPRAAAGTPDHGDVAVSSSKIMALLFWLFALITVGGAAFVITRKNLITAVMGMVGAFVGISALYMMLFASFLAVVQMLVYAGAIMVLFVFVIMILNKPEDEPWGTAGKLGKGIAGLGLAYLGFRLVTLLWNVVPAQPKTAALAPLPVQAMVGKDKVEYAWGGTQAVGDALFNQYLFPFEAVSILLLVAVVGAIAVARPLKDDDGVGPEVTP